MSSNNYGLYVGGNYIIGQDEELTQKYVAKYGDNTGSFDIIYNGLKDNSVYGSIQSMCGYEDELYIAGSYIDNFNTKQYLSKLINDGISFEPSLINNKGVINTMIVYKDELYIGGAINTDNNLYKSKMYVAKMEGNSFTQITIDVQGFIRDMIIYNDKLYICGNYTDSSRKKYVAKMEGNSFTQITNGLDKNNSEKGIIYSMTICKNELYIAGSYIDQSYYHQYVAKMTGDSFDSPIGGLFKQSEKDSEIFVIISFNDQLYVGGYYHGDTMRMKQYAAKMEGNSFMQITNGLYNQDDLLESEIYDMTVYKNNLYICGYIPYEESPYNEQYVAKYNKGTNSFDSPIEGLIGQYSIDSQINTIVSFEPKNEAPKEDDVKDKNNNLALILGLSIGLGLGIPLLIYLKMRINK